MLKPKIYIIILNWNRSGDTLDCIKSINSLSADGFEIFVVIVDNGSTDESVKQLMKYKTDKFKIHIIKNDRNLGFAAGNNVGIRYALENNADYLFLLNNDTTVDKNIIVEFIKAAEDNNGVGIFTPKIYFAKGYEYHKKYKPNELGRVIWSAGGKIDWANVYAGNFGVDQVDNGKFNKNTSTDFATGAAMFVKNSVFRKYGNFDERYFMYFEDVDFCERYIKKGGKILFVNKAVVWHKVAQSSGIGSDLNDYFLTRNRLLFGMGYAPLRTKLALYKESVKFLMSGRLWQKRGVIDFYTAKFGRGSWPGTRKD